MLDAELEELLRKNLEIAQDTNRMLHSMRRRAFWGGIMKFVWWFLLLFGIPLFAYYFYLQPYLTSLQDAYGNAQSGLTQVGSFGNTIKQLLSTYGF